MDVQRALAELTQDEHDMLFSRSFQKGKVYASVNKGWTYCIRILDCTESVVTFRYVYETADAGIHIGHVGNAVVDQCMIADGPTGTDWFFEDEIRQASILRLRSGDYIVDMGDEERIRFVA